jgi:metallophosphoesterase (TIGR03767 family)
MTVALAALSAGPAFAQPTTTVQRTIGDRDGDNRLEYDSGEDYTLLPQGGLAPHGYRRPNTASIFNFLQLSDFQTVDEESPGRVEFLDTTQRGPFLNPFSAAYRPQEALSTQFVEAMVRQVRNTNSQVTGDPLRLAITTGDNADSQQYNETRWFIDILDGRQRVDPNSGVPDDTCDVTPTDLYDGPQGGGDAGYYNPDGDDDGDGYSPDTARNAATTGRAVTVRDYPHLLETAQRPFRALGLGMPWYSVFGNHDALVQGNDGDAYIGPVGSGGETSNPVLQEFVTGCVKPGTLPPGAGTPAEEFAKFFADPAGYAATTDPATVPRDDRRCYVAKDVPAAAPDPCSTGGWIQQHFNTTGTPVGHGFADRPAEAIANHDGYYSFSPRPGLRFVVLDTITDECGAPFCSEGSIDNTQYLWIGKQLEAARDAGQYVIVFSHHTERTTRLPSTDPTEEPIHFGERPDEDAQNPGGVATLEDLLCTHSNVLAHVDGHEHQNFVKHHSCDQNDLPAGLPGDYWEVSTASHIDWPQQSRMIELFHQDDGSMAMALTILDHDGPANPGDGPADAPNVLRLASIGRELAFNDYQAGPKSGSDARGTREDRNVIIDLKRPFPCATPCVGQ